MLIDKSLGNIDWGDGHGGGQFTRLVGNNKSLLRTMPSDYAEAKLNTLCSKKTTLRQERQTVPERDRCLSSAVRHFWKTGNNGVLNQPLKSPQMDSGPREAVADKPWIIGFVHVIRKMFVDAGISKSSVHVEESVELPGYFRPEKKWDVAVLAGKRVIAAMDFKSQAGSSFEGSQNILVEELLGAATDLWAAYRAGAFEPSIRPWLGCLVLMDENAASVEPVRTGGSHFPVFREFKNASSGRNCEMLLLKLLQERLYDGTCLLLSGREDAASGNYREPNAELSFKKFSRSLLGQALAFERTR